MYGLPFFQTILWIKDIFCNQYIFSGPNGVFIMDVPLYIVLYLLFIMLIIMLVELGTDRHIDLKDGTLALSWYS